MSAPVDKSTIRILVADDHALFRDGMRALFAGIPGYDLVGEAATGKEAVLQVGALQPDVVLMDIQMSDLNGIEATRRILAEHPTTRVVMVTMFEEDEMVFAAMRAGARGYVLKGVDQEELLRAIRAAGRGEALFGPAIAARLAAFFAHRRETQLPTPFSTLTLREQEVLELIAQGKNNEAIAGALCISSKTVRNHVSNVLSKLQAVDRAEAIVRAREVGFGHDQTR